MVMVFLTKLELQTSYITVRHGNQKKIIDGDGFLTSLELEMTYIAVRHISRKEIIRNASLKYLDA
eukprot:6681905-Pyramimonas_sp.AAC.1